VLSGVVILVITQHSHHSHLGSLAVLVITWLHLSSPARQATFDLAIKIASWSHQMSSKVMNFLGLSSVFTGIHHSSLGSHFDHPMGCQSVIRVSLFGHDMTFATSS
jgi:hypothetical protein